MLIEIIFSPPVIYVTKIRLEHHSCDSFLASVERDILYSYCIFYLHIRSAQMWERHTHRQHIGQNHHYHYFILTHKHKRKKHLFTIHFNVKLNKKQK